MKIFKQLTKSHPATLLAALAELHAQLASCDIPQMLAGWALVFPRLLLDHNVSVRTQTMLVHSDICKHSAQFKPILSDICSMWLLALFDPAITVQNSARRALDTAYPRKLANLLLYSKDTIDAYLSNLLQAGEAGPLGPADQERYPRLLIGTVCLVGLIHQHNIALKLEKSREFWQLCASTDVTVRKAMFEYISERAEKRTFDTLELELVCKYFVAKCIREPVVSAHDAMWTAVLAVLKAYPESWEMASAKKSLANSLIDATKNERCLRALSQLLPLLPHAFVQTGIDWSKMLQTIRNSKNKPQIAISVYYNCWIFYAKLNIDSVVLVAEFMAPITSGNFPTLLVVTSAMQTLQKCEEECRLETAQIVSGLNDLLADLLTRASLDILAALASNPLKIVLRS